MYEALRGPERSAIPERASAHSASLACAHKQPGDNISTSSGDHNDYMHWHANRPKFKPGLDPAPFALPACSSCKAKDFAKRAGLGTGCGPPVSMECRAPIFHPRIGNTSPLASPSDVGMALCGGVLSMSRRFLHAPNICSCHTEALSWYIYSPFDDEGLFGGDGDFNITSNPVGALIICWRND